MQTDYLPAAGNAFAKGRAHVKGRNAYVKERIGRKAQAVTFDFILATVTFLVVLTIVMSYWYYSMMQMQDVRRRTRL